MKRDKDILMLIDGNALIHRSYHGIPLLKTKDGRLVNAVYGFANSIFASVKEFKPKYLAVAFDISKATKRIEKYKEYKAHRVEMDDELFAQIPLVRKVCDVLNYPKIGIKGYEADDVIGTIAKKLQVTCLAEPRRTNNKLQVIIVTGDMDILQLVDENTSVYSLARGVKKAQLFNIDKVKEKYGFSPKYLIDYKGLRGDPSDNIPGVPGIGDKTAKKLINEFGTIENLYKYVEDNDQRKSAPSLKSCLNPRLLALLKENKEKAMLSKDLATIDKNTPLDFKLADAKISDYDQGKAKKLFEELEFKSLIKKMPEAKAQIQQDKLF